MPAVLLKFMACLFLITIQKLQSFKALDLRTISRCSYSTTIGLANDRVSDIDDHYMQLALRHAQHAFREMEVPIGAVIVDRDGTVLATARNRVEVMKDVTMHAEIDCIRKVSSLLGNWRLIDCTLYSTLEPCPMCLSAIQGSRIKRVVYGAKDIRLGACGSHVNLIDSHPFHVVEVTGGVREAESSILLRRFFQLRRREDRRNHTNTNMFDRAIQFHNESLPAYP